MERRSQPSVQCWHGYFCLGFSSNLKGACGLKLLRQTGAAFGEPAVGADCPARNSQYRPHRQSQQPVVDKGVYPRDRSSRPLLRRAGDTDRGQGESRSPSGSRQASENSALGESPYNRGPAYADARGYCDRPDLTLGRPGCENIFRRLWNRARVNAARQLLLNSLPVWLVWAVIQSCRSFTRWIMGVM